MKKSEVITNRLAAAGSFVRRGARLCDVGTDHAYLPVFLCKAGIAESALASDINAGPCRRAAENVRLHGCEDKIRVVCADGLSGAGDFSPTDVVIAGMGGELIRDIIFASPIPRSPGVRLILQPMTKAPALRGALASHGFEIVDETLAKDDRIYQIICAEYTGKTAALSELQMLLGPVNMRKIEPLFGEFVDKHIKEQKKILFSKNLHGISADREKTLISALEAIRPGKKEEK